ncbi:MULTISPECIES: type VI secretion system amidase effector protein Tae4 [unclassified Pseudomonas]|uniref:type VI secretion system amidase effector protein Tae4 n=1 Tax=unclassified Pseudomonas TaxID=196821 RepID=UPI00384C597D
MAKPSFFNLQRAYPPVDSPCDGPWDNQCAIRMSIALNGEMTIKVNKATYSEPKCAHDHARGAESLANWLWRHHLGRPIILNGSAEDRQRIAEKTGIIFFKDCFSRLNETPDQRSGDHIDLWDRGRTEGFADDTHMSRQVWFWELT